MAVTQNTTPSAPVPPDELIEEWKLDYSLSLHGYFGPYIARRAAAWVWAQAMQEREELAEALTDLVQSLDDLIAQSDGVAGLHLNGDIADWDSLLEGGRFEGWLIALSLAAAAERLRGGK